MHKIRQTLVNITRIQVKQAHVIKVTLSIEKKHVGLERPFKGKETWEAV